MRDRGRRHRIFQNEIPSDDPSEHLAKRRVSICIGGAGDGSHGGELGIAERGEDTCGAAHEKRNHKGGPGLVVCDGAHYDENACAYDRSDSEGRERDRSENATQPVFAIHLIQEYLDGLLLEQSFHGMLRFPGVLEDTVEPASTGARKEALVSRRELV